MVPDGTIYTLMAMGLLSVLLLPVLLWDRLRIPRPKLRRVCGAAPTALLLLTSLEYVYQSNGCYRVLEWHNIQTENYYATLFTRIKAMEGYDENYPVIFSGAVISDASIPFFTTVGYGSLTARTRKTTASTNSPETTSSAPIWVTQRVRFDLLRFDLLRKSSIPTCWHRCAPIRTTALSAS